MLNITLTLNYLATAVHVIPLYKYSGSLVGNTQGQYNALKWHDAHTKPTWQTILDNSEAAWAWHQASRPYTSTEMRTKIDGLQGDVDGIEGGMGGPITVADVTGLQSDLDGKAALAHGHVVADIDPLQTILNNINTALTGLSDALSLKANSSHTHISSQITDFNTSVRALLSAVSGIAYDSATGQFSPSYGSAHNTLCQGDDSRLSDARVPLAHNQGISTITSLQAALDTIVTPPFTIAQITNLQASLDAKAATGASITASQVSDFDTHARGLISALSGLSYNSTTGAISPTYGTGANTFTQGNDTRLSDARTPTAHVHVIADTTDLQTELNKRPIVYQGSTQKTNPKMVCKQATVASGVAVFYLTDNALVGGNALFTNVYQESLEFQVNDASNQYQYGWSLSGKTLTVTVNKIGTANLITGILGFPSAANGTTVNMSVWGD